MGWHIESGRFGNASLDGPNVAAFFYTPGPMHQGNWSAALYLDSRASADFQGSVDFIAAGRAAAHRPTGRGAVLADLCLPYATSWSRGQGQAPAILITALHDGMPSQREAGCLRESHRDDARGSRMESHASTKNAQVLALRNAGPLLLLTGQLAEQPMPLAILQSRLTVSGEILRDSAVSSTLCSAFHSPAKSS